MCEDLPFFIAGNFNAHIGMLDCGNITFPEANWKIVKSSFLNKPQFSPCSSKVDPLG